MPKSTPEQSPINALIALKSQYEQALAEAGTQSIHLREQLAHVNALLLNQLVPSNGGASLQVNLRSAEPVLEMVSPADYRALAPVIAEAPATVSETPKGKAGKLKPEAKPMPGGRTPRELLPAYQGLKRLDAIAQALEAAPGAEITIDALIHALFGNLSAAEHKSERLRLKTLMYQGEKRKLWQKGSIPSSYLIKGSTGKDKGRGSKAAPQPPSDIAADPVAAVVKPAAKARVKAIAPKSLPDKAAKTKQRISLAVLPVYAQLTKRDAIAQVLGQHPGEVLHHDTIIQTLYGDLSPAELKAERVRIKTALLTGVKDGKWQKAAVPSSYFLGAAAAVAKSKRAGRPAKTPRKKLALA
jgi:hypothetical protein